MPLDIGLSIKDLSYHAGCGCEPLLFVLTWCMAIWHHIIKVHDCMTEPNQLEYYRATRVVTISAPACRQAPNASILHSKNEVNPKYVPCIDQMLFSLTL